MPRTGRGSSGGLGRGSRSSGPDPLDNRQQQAIQAPAPVLDQPAIQLQEYLERLRKMQNQNRRAAIPLQKSATGQLLDLNPAVGERLLADLASTANPAAITMDTLASNPAYAAIKDAIETSFDQARSSAFEDTAVGGALSGVLGGIEGQRGAAGAQGFGALAAEQQRLDAERRQRAVENALGGQGRFTDQFTSASTVKELASQGGRSVVDSMIQLRQGDAHIQAGIASAQAERDAAKKGGTGSAVGSIAGALIGKK